MMDTDKLISELKKMSQEMQIQLDKAVEQFKKDVQKLIETKK